MKARKVKGLDPEASLADNVERIVHVRLDELCSFIPAALDPSNVTELHDMRIAAKRLRYILEVAAPVFGPYAATAAKRAKELQDVLGEIHDCDVTMPQVHALLGQQREQAVAALGARAGEAEDLDPALLRGLPGADAWRGLEQMAVYLQARRELLHRRFVAAWTALQREGFVARLQFAVGERAEVAA